MTLTCRVCGLVVRSDSHHDSRAAGFVGCVVVINSWLWLLPCRDYGRPGAADNPIGVNGRNRMATLFMDLVIFVTYL